MTPATIEAIFKIWHTENPKPHTELHYSNPYQLLIAVLLSAQMTDKGVNKATENLFKTIHTPQDMLDLGLEALKTQIKTINYYPTKAKHIMATSTKLVNEYEGKIPPSRQELESLPGIGRKSANVILNVVFQEPTIPVDTHVLRVCQRTGLVLAKTTIAIEKKLLRIIPKTYRPYAHHWLVLHGRYLCKARKPLCHMCSIQQYCAHFLKNTPPAS